MRNTSDNKKARLCIIFFVIATGIFQGRAAIETDVCVYGGTSGGVVASVQCARLGKSVVLLQPGNHIGGMTSGGLGWTDYGNQSAIGGISREFYTRIGARYGKAIQWTFEPHVAEEVFKEMLQEAKAPVYYRQRLAAVRKEGNKIVEITMEDGRVYRAKMFIDATYEGDLMAMAGVSFTVGRESVNTYGESLNGIRANTPAHQFVVNVDPYVEPGNPASGLLPYIQPGDGGTPGDGDHRVQAYNFRLCLTQNATNKIPIEPPPNYEPFNYELLARYIQARLAAGHTLNLRSFLKIDSIPNGKTDVNNNGAFSTDFIGMNYTYPTNTYAERERIWQEHEYYIRGLLHFLANDPRVPENVRSEMQSWGLCKDEFQDTGGWPHQLYVREARRMISDYVMTQSDCLGQRTAADSVGIGSYTMDSHNCQRIVQNGYVRNEGDVQASVPKPYPISYRSIVPRSNECQNLFVTFALSASHIAFGSIRMEPVFMILSQSAATAAAFAIDDDLPVQAVNYEKLKIQLLADGQLLTWGSDQSATGAIVVDNSDSSAVAVTGDWTASTSKPGYWGANYIHDGNTNKGQKSVRFTPNIPSNGVYEVYVRWTDDPNRADNVPIDVIHANGTNTFIVNQKSNGGVWNFLVSTSFVAGTSGSVVIRTDATSGYVVADAVLFVPVGYTNLSTIQVIASDAVASEYQTNTARFIIMRSGNTNTALMVNYQLSGTAQNGVDYQPLNGSITFPPGNQFATITVVPIPDSKIEGTETVILNLTSGTDYVVGTLSNATVNIFDKPYGLWKYSHFASEITNLDISGDYADPDGDNIVNIKEYVLGLNPKKPDTNFDSLPIAQYRNGQLTLTLRKANSAVDYNLQFEVSDNLTRWTWSPARVQTEILTNDGSFTTIRATYIPQTQDAPRGFIRWQPIPAD